MTTCDEILSQMEKWAAEEAIIPPGRWVDLAFQLNILCGTEQNKLVELESTLSKIRVGWIESGKSVAESKERSQATEEWKEAQKLKAKIDRIFEMIKLAKVKARMTIEEFKGN